MYLSLRAARKWGFVTCFILFFLLFILFLSGKTATMGSEQITLFDLASQAPHTSWSLNPWKSK